MTELIERLGDGLDRACLGGHLPRPEPRDPGRLNEYDTPAYIRAVVDRLISLGLMSERRRRHFERGLPRAGDSDQADARRLYARQVKKLQAMAGLAPDGWAGPQTWHLLNCLVSFENDQVCSRWQFGGARLSPDHPIIRRAVYLRLQVMGFFERFRGDRLTTRTAIELQDNPRFARALDRFCHFAEALGIIAPGQPRSLSWPLLGALFQYDVIIRLLGEPATQARLARRHGRQLAAIARIELWLQGYDVRPGVLVFRRARRAKGRRQSTFALAIRAYWRDHPRPAELDWEAADISAALFWSFRHALEDAPDSADPLAVPADVDARLAQVVAHKERSFATQLGHLTQGIWDGIKRVARWLGRWIRAAANIAATALANLARYVARSGRRVYAAITRAIAVVHSGIDYLRHPLFRQPASGSAFILRQADFDQQLVLADSCPPGVAQTLISNYQHQSRVYVAATRIFASLVAITRTLVRTTSVSLNWLLALLALSRLSRNLDAIQRELALLDEISPELSAGAPLSLAVT